MICEKQFCFVHMHTCALLFTRILPTWGRKRRVNANRHQHNIPLIACTLFYLTLNARTGHTAVVSSSFSSSEEGCSWWGEDYWDCVDKRRLSLCVRDELLELSGEFLPKEWRQRGVKRTKVSSPRVLSSNNEEKQAYMQSNGIEWSKIIKRVRWKMVLYFRSIYEIYKVSSKGILNRRNKVWLKYSF